MSTEVPHRTNMFSDAYATFREEFARKLGDKSACIWLDGLPTPYKHMYRIWRTHPHSSNLTCLSSEPLLVPAVGTVWPWRAFVLLWVVVDIISSVNHFKCAELTLEELPSVDFWSSEEELSDFQIHHIDHVPIRFGILLGWQTLGVKFICCYALHEIISTYG